MPHPQFLKSLAVARVRSPEDVDVDVTVARIGRAHGLRGDVVLDVRTDDPRARLAPGTVLRTEPAELGPLTIDRVRNDSGRWYAAFVGHDDRTAAEALRGVALVVAASDVAEEDAWYAAELRGLRVENLDGDLIGEVVDLLHRPAQDLLEVRVLGGWVALVPFVRQIVPVVDVDGGRIVLDPPTGLLGEE